MLTCQINRIRRPRERHLTAPRPAVSPPLTTTTSALPQSPVPSQSLGSRSRGTPMVAFWQPPAARGHGEHTDGIAPHQQIPVLRLDWAGWRKCPQKLPSLCVDPAHCQQLQMAAGEPEALQRSSRLSQPHTGHFPHIQSPAF